MEGRVKFRVDLEAYKYDDVEDKDTIVLKDPVSAKYFYLSSYEYRLLRTLDGNLTLEEPVERLKISGYCYSLEDANAISGKAAHYPRTVNRASMGRITDRHCRRMSSAHRGTVFSRTPGRCCA